MAKDRQEELKNLLVSTDFKEETYVELSMQELIILCKSAKSTKEKNVSVQNAALFFSKREEFFMHLIMRKLQNMENIYVLMAKVTNLPYVYCDPDSCNDQVWIFSEERFARKVAMQEMQSKRELLVAKIEKKAFLGFYLSLFPMGVNSLLIDKGVNFMEADLEKLVKKPDYSSVPEEKRPVVNPELTLTAAYFAQERNMPEESRDNAALRELEEEMVVNLQRGKLLVPVKFPEEVKTQEDRSKVQLKDMKFPILKMQNGKTYQPICADGAEFQRFNRDKSFHAITLDCANLKKIMNNELSGIILNPMTLRLAIPKEKL